MDYYKYKLIYQTPNQDYLFHLMFKQKVIE